MHTCAAGASRDLKKEQLSDVMAFGRDVASRKEHLRVTAPDRAADMAEKIAQRQAAAATAAKPAASESDARAMDRRTHARKHVAPVSSWTHPRRCLAAVLREVEERRAALDANDYDADTKAQLALEISQRVPCRAAPRAPPRPAVHYPYGS